MSKLAIFLCVALFASAANAWSWPNPLNDAQQGLKNLLDGTMNQVRSKITEAKRSADDLIQKIKDQATNEEKDASDDVSSKVDDAVSDVNELINNVTSVDVTKCRELVDHLQVTAKSTLLQVKQCFVETRETALGHVNNVVQISEGVLDNLNLLKTEGSDCLNNDFWSANTPLVCTNVVAAKALLATAKAIPLISVEAAELGVLVSTLPQTFTKCTTISALTIFNNEVSSIVEQTSQCIRQKIDEINNGITQVPEISASEIAQ